ncbi:MULTISPECIES: GTP pyrophosphokinase [Nocardiopsidaceae]|uniref:GTP pyrophosphokinase family protein n=2 Tax=Nocardiopsidaceae TaxID=83676 RepID=A0ABY6YSI7_9ACTN|nr:GTP pyrophosphokinase family protein [Streptomonospora nanhaiensis]WAE75327.1 GTP pyrophosphokinase family protein [Streptomonospora nanhaiensis]
MVGDDDVSKALSEARDDVARFLMSYKFAIDTTMAKVNILNEEFRYVHDHNPIEHVSSRLKSPASIMEKARRRNCSLDLGDIRATILDIAGIRITCSFVSDVYTIRDMLAGHEDIRVTEVKDYVEAPKANGYRSLHLLVETPVRMSDRTEQVPVEIQIRTIAMDFWASLEHKIYYKYAKDVPRDLLDELREAAETANRLDVTMERLHNEVRELGDGTEDRLPGPEELRALPVAEDLLRALSDRVRGASG